MTDELIVEPLDQRVVSQRRRRFSAHLPQQLGTIPQEWRDLLSKWVRRGGNSRWETLARDAGNNRVALADQLREWLLREGWAAVIEQRKHGGWWPHSVELRKLPHLRASLGIRDKESDALRWQTARSELGGLLCDALSPVLLVLDDLPMQRALARQDLVAALQRWLDAQRSGTRRDFALYARGSTKAITDAEWNWLNEAIDLAELGIEGHTPLLLLAAPITLQMPAGTMNLDACVHFAALTPATLSTALSACGTPRRWQLVENRTSFERVARTRAPDTGVIWLPGFPPAWWREAVTQLLALAPAPAEIACDPDPAGIAIALQAGALWEAARLDWQPWYMDIATLQRLPAQNPLNAWDQMRIAQLTQCVLPNALSELLVYMNEHNVKGEQEGIL